MEKELLTLKDCKEVAARIWCDSVFEHVTMDTEAALKIADFLYEAAKSQGK